MLNRRNFLKACGVGVVAPLGLVGKAETVQEQMERVTREYSGGPDLLASPEVVELCPVNFLQDYLDCMNSEPLGREARLNDLYAKMRHFTRTPLSGSP